MLADMIGCLVCPNCGADLALVDGALRCASGHSFDVARAGYVNLLPGRAHTGTADTPAMLAARAAFLGNGHYAEVADEVASACARVAPEVPGCVVDIGAGTGYYLAAALDAAPERIGVALDISKHAMRYAARAHPRIGAIVVDAWRSIPLRAGSAAVVLDIFSPRNGAEFRRILHPGGALVVVTPTPRHLQELIEPLGLLHVDEDKDVRVADSLGPLFERVSATPVEHTMMLAHEDMLAVAQMGPSAWHTGADALEARVSVLESPTPVTLSVVVATYRPL